MRDSASTGAPSPAWHKAGSPTYRRAPAGSMLEPPEPVMREVLADWPRIKGSRMTEILRGHGYADSEELVKLRLHRHAPA